MVVAPLERGEVVADYSDVRAPGHVPGRYADLEVHPAGNTYGEGRCDRHLFDVLERACDDDSDLDEGVGDEAYERAVQQRDAGWYPQRFDARLTCVRCGVVESWRGTRQLRSWEQLDAVPLEHGGLRAQQVAGGDYPTFTVYDEAGQRVGVISWARGTRGRRYFEGRLGEVRAAEGDPKWEAPSPQAVLRRLSRLHRERQDEQGSTT
ncbi:MAG: hypothetical protein EON52_13760 [Actinomycetales bacterium]|nr:MAG: hypothetical protein EON52_13760 [Actinomycetales bacterium]